MSKAEIDYLLQLKRAPVDESVMRILEDKDPVREPQEVQQVVSIARVDRDEVYSQTTLNRLPTPASTRPNMPKNAFPIQEHEIPTLEETS